MILSAVLETIEKLGPFFFVQIREIARVSHQVRQRLLDVSICRFLELKSAVVVEHDVCVVLAVILFKVEAKLVALVLASPCQMKNVVFM